MKARITDAVSLSRITPIVLNKYLEVMGWSQQETWRDRIVVWSKTDESRTEEALVPLREESVAYATRIAETLSALERVEERSQLDIYYEVLGVGADTIRLSAPNDVIPDVWSLDRDAALMSHAKDMMMVSAKMAETPGKAILNRRPSALALDYVRRLRVLPGYGADNSLTIQSTVPPSSGIQRELGNDAEDPFARAAVRALNEGLHGAFNAAQQVLSGKGESVFGDAPSQGVSANLCEVVASLVEVVHGLQINVAWAPVRQMEDHGSQLIFGQSTAEALRSGAVFLRHTNPELDVALRGEIVRLDRSARKDFDGKAVVLGEVDGEWQRFETQFEMKDQEPVSRAFHEKLWITLSGDIHRKGNRRAIHNPTSLKLGDKIEP